MSKFFILVILFAITPFLLQIWIGVGLIFSRIPLLSFIAVGATIIFARICAPLGLLLLPKSTLQPRAILGTVRLIAKWPLRSANEFLKEYRALERLPTIKQGMKELRIASLFEYYWRRDILPTRAPSLISSWQKPIVFIPGIKAKAFYPEDLYPWVSSAIAMIPDIQAEMQPLLTRDSGFLPYHNEFGLPTHPFVKCLEEGMKKYEKDDWNMFFFYRGGQEITQNHRACPATSQFLKSIPELEKTMVCFSALRPGVWVPPHFGMTNAIVRIHLPLVAPAKCAIRVGSQTREWQPGVPLLFDDSFEHEVWNRSNQTRIVLFINAFHPALDAAERDALSRFLIESFSRCPGYLAWRELKPKSIVDQSKESLGKPLSAA